MPLDIPPGPYIVPVLVSGQGSTGVGDLVGSVNLVLCVQPASSFAPSYFATAFDPVVVAPRWSPFTMDPSSLLLPSANASVVSVTGRGAVSLPSWLSFNTSTGLLTGFPVGTIRGDYLVDIQFAVRGATADLVVVVVRVPNTAPTFVSPLGPVRRVAVGRRTLSLGPDFVDAEGDARSFGLAFSLAADGVSLVAPSSIVYIEAPTGRLTVNSINGDQGSFPLNVTCTDVYGGTGYVLLTIVIDNQDPSLAQSLPPLPVVTEGQSFTYTFPRDLFTDDDGDSNITYTVSGPAWLAFDAALRLVSGTPTRSDAGVRAVVITARDAFGGQGSVTASLSVNANPVVVNVTGGWASPASPIVLPGVGVAINVSVPTLFSDDDSDPVTYVVGDGSQAPWLSIVNSEDRSARWLVGRPDRNNHAAVSVTIVGRDGRGGVSGAVWVVLWIGNSAPEAGSSGLPGQTVAVGSVQVVSIPRGAFSDADGDSLTFAVSRVSGNGSGTVGSFVSVSGSSVVIGPRTGMQGSYVLRLSAVDGQNGSASSEFTVDVPNQAPSLAYTIPVPPAATALTPWVYTLDAKVFTDPGRCGFVCLCNSVLWLHLWELDICCMALQVTLYPPTPW